MRLCQELVLGIGGVRALRALGIDPAVWHLNEGHSAFLLIERARELLAVDPSLAAREALNRVGRDAVFTIHTPVPAGNEVFARDLVAPALRPWLAAARMEPDELLELGRGPTDEPNAPFDMTAFVLRHASNANAVCSSTPDRHRDLAGPGRPSDRGHHERRPRPDLARPPGPPAIRRAVQVPLRSTSTARSSSPTWATSTTRSCGAPTSSRSARWSASSRAASPASSPATGSRPTALREVRSVLDADALTIGFARRFATYKRADLLFRDEERLDRILSSDERPVQIVIAGKAHPADRPGSRSSSDIFELSRSDRLRGRVFVIEDYDIRIARFLVGGVDLWLNNPRRPLEASGTSGMKAAINGVPSAVDPRRLVGRGLQRRRTAGRSATVRPLATTANRMRPTRARSTGSWRRRSSRASSSGPMGCRPTGWQSCAARSLRPLAVQYGADAHRVRRPSLPARSSDARRGLTQAN